MLNAKESEQQQKVNKQVQMDNAMSNKGEFLH